MAPDPNDFDEFHDATPKRWAGLGMRIISAFVLASIALVCIWQGSFLFTLFVLLAALVMKKEWDALVIMEPSISLRAGGYAYIILPCASLIWLRAIPGAAGINTTIALIAMIAATDIGAYFVGRKFGHHKLSPIISPNKTWEGLGGGIIAATVTAIALSPSIPLPHTIISAFWVGPFIALLAQAGDLFESSLKRNADVKDSGTLLPGHGGLLDRFDGYMFAAPVYALLIHFAMS